MPPQYRNILLVEQPNGDFAQTMVRQFFYSAFADLYWRAMMASTDPTPRRDRRQVGEGERLPFAPRLGMADPPGRRHRVKATPRTAEAVATLWSYTGEMFDADAVEQGLIADGIALDPATLRPHWDGTVQRVFHEATLDRPANAWMQHGGTLRPAYGASGPSADRDAAFAADLPGRRLVKIDLRSRAWNAAAEVVDPEIPVLTIADLGVLRDVVVTEGRVEGGDHADLFRLPGR